jgi:hypothetical protein
MPDSEDSNARFATIKKGIEKERSMPPSPHPFISPSFMKKNCLEARMQIETQELERVLGLYKPREIFIGLETPYSSTPRDDLKSGNDSFPPFFGIFC